MYKTNRRHPGEAEIDVDEYPTLTTSLHGLYSNHMSVFIFTDTRYSPHYDKLSPPPDNYVD